MIVGVVGVVLLEVARVGRQQWLLDVAGVGCRWWLPEVADEGGCRNLTSEVVVGVER